MPSSKHSRAGSGSDPPKKHRASLGRRAKETLPSSAYKQKKLAPLRRPRSTPTTRLWAVKQILRVKERRDGVRHYLIQWENTVDKRGKITHYPLSWEPEENVSDETLRDFWQTRIADLEADITKGMTKEILGEFYQARITELEKMLQ